MMRAGQVVLFRFPQADLAAGKLRPALLIAKLPGPYEDWLICMISSQLRQVVPDFDEIVHEADTDFGASGLKAPSAIRMARLAVIEPAIMEGAIGEISSDRLQRLKARLADWLRN